MKTRANLFIASLGLGSPLAGVMISKQYLTGCIIDIPGYLSDLSYCKDNTLLLCTSRRGIEDVLLRRRHTPFRNGHLKLPGFDCSPLNNIFAIFSTFKSRYFVNKLTQSACQFFPRFGTSLQLSQSI